MVISTYDAERNDGYHEHDNAEGRSYARHGFPHHRFKVTFELACEGDDEGAVDCGHREHDRPQHERKVP